MQPGYVYELTEPRGCVTAEFSPVFTPGEMLRLGVFEGKYMTDCAHEYPEEMFAGARFSASPDAAGMNAFGVKSRSPMSYWQERGWIHPQDPRGWFEWYCRWWLGRRTEDDARQISRWRRFAPRHAGALLAFGEGDVERRRATRQALLQWSHDPLPDLEALPGESIVGKTCRVLGVELLGESR